MCSTCYEYGLFGPDEPTGIRYLAALPLKLYHLLLLLLVSVACYIAYEHMGDTDDVLISPSYRLSNRHDLSLIHI